MAGQQTSIDEQVNKLVRHSGGRVGKLVQVDGMTRELLCLLFGVILSWGGLIRAFGPGRGLVREFCPRRVSLDRLSAVRIILSYGIWRNCVRANYVRAKSGECV